MPYKAFISYSHATDGKLAPALQSALHRFAKPWWRLRSMRVFRDRTNLAANPHLWPSIERALSDSEYLLLFASPQSAASHWVAQEVTWWLTQSAHSRPLDRLLILLTDGELVWDRAAGDYDWSRTSSLPTGLRGRFADEPLYVDFRWARGSSQLSLRHSRFRNAVLDIAATLLGRDKDALDGADVRQHRRNLRWAAGAATALALTTLAALTAAVMADYQRGLAVSRQLAARAELLAEQHPARLPAAVELSAAALRRASRFRFLDRAQTFEATQTLQTAMTRLGPQPHLQRTTRGLLMHALGAAGPYLAEVPYDGPTLIRDLTNGALVVELPPPRVKGMQADGLRHPVFSADGTWFAAVASLGMAGLAWSLPDGTERFRTPGSGIVAIALSPHGERVAAADTEGSVRVWNLDDGAELAAFELAGPAQLLRFGPEGRRLAGTCSSGIPGACPEETQIALWDVTRGEQAATLNHAAAVTAVVFSPDGSRLATTRRVGPEQLPAQRVGRVSIWDAASGRRIAQVQQPEQVTALAFTRSGDYLLTAGRDGNAILWDTGTGDELVVFPHGAAVLAAGLMRVRDVPQVWTAAGDGLLRVWALQEPAVERLRLPQGTAVLAAAAGDDHLITITHDLQADAATDPRQYQREVRAWSLEDLAALLPLSHPHLVGGLRFSADGRRLATFDSRMPEMQFVPGATPRDARFTMTDAGGGSVRLWDVASHRQLAAAGHPAAVLAFDLSADGSHLASACADGRARVFDTQGSTVASRTWEGWVVNVTFGPRGRLLAVASGSPALLQGAPGAGLVSLWDWQQDKELARVSSGQLYDALAFSPAGRLLAAGAWDGRVRLLKTSGGGTARVLRHDQAVRALAFSPDGRWLAVGTGGADPNAPGLRRGATVLWRLDDDTPTELSGQASWTGAVAFSADGSHLAAIDQAGRIGLWRVRGLRQVGSLVHGEQSPDVSVHFAPDHRHLVSVVGATAKVWDLGSGREVARHRHEHGSLSDARFSPDGAWLATASTDATARLWRWRPADLVAEACRRLPSKLSDAQWRSLAGRPVSRLDVCADAGGPR